MDFITYAAAVKAARKGVPYVEEGGLVEILPECQPAFAEDEGMFFIADAPALEIGKTYLVTWNGSQYECVGQDGAALGETGAVIMGDVYTLSGGNAGTAPTGEPFVIMGGQQENGGMILAIFPIDGTTELTLSIYGNDVIAHKIDPRCLPDGVPYVEGNVLLEETSAESFTHPTFGQAWNIMDVPLNLTVGETYTIVYNGTPYQCVCQTAPDGFTGDPDAVAMGNFAAIGGTNTGEPFALLYQPNYQDMAILDFVGSTAVNVGIIDGFVRKLDPICLPGNIGGVKFFNVNMTAENAKLTSIDKTFAEIVAAAKEANTIVRGLIYDNAGGCFYLQLVAIAENYAALGTVFAQSSSSVLMATVIVYSDGTTNLVFQA